MAPRREGRLSERLRRSLGSTRTKMRVAHLAFRTLQAAGVPVHQQATRRGIRFDLDLREGIDLAIYLFGGFQDHVGGIDRGLLPGDPVILDVGANVGALTLAWARAFPAARVFAFEPTAFAFEKLVRNVELNPRLAPRIELHQAFVTASDDEDAAPAVYASWRIDDLAGDRHGVHLGEAKEVAGRSTTLDRFVRERALERVDLVKIDTDGHELDVLRGAQQVLRDHRPLLLFEVGRYLLDERGQGFEEFEELLLPLGYRLFDQRTGASLDHDNLAQVVPAGGTLDVLALVDRLE